MSSDLRLATLAAALACVALTSACSIIIAPENEGILCQLDPAYPDPCPMGFRCTDGRCLEPSGPPPPPDGCVPAEESCNGQDDNCNGIVDEGVDADGDGYTFCGTQRGPDGVLIAGPLLPEFQDCADDDPNTYPGAMERCDGIDNDCSAATPRDPNEIVCPSALICSERTRSCVDPLDCTAFPCGGGDICDPETRRCVPEACPTCTSDQRCDVATSTCVSLRADGEGCNSDDECMSRSCFDFMQLGATHSNPTRGVCSRACCSDSQCPGASDVCFEAQSGARACLPATGPTAFGLAVRAGASCSSLAGMCTLAFQPRGWCEQGSESVCYFSGAYSCVVGLGSGDCGTRCESGGVCGDNTTGCGFVLSNDTVSGVCFVSRTRPYVDAGGGCSLSTDCRDGVCIAGTCAVPCCSDADCGALRCLPSPGTFALMRCQPGAAPLL